MKNKIYLSPSRYIQGTGILQNLAEYMKRLGDRILILTSAGNRERFSRVLSELASEKDCTIMTETFSGECTMEEIRRICGECEEKEIQVIAGFGEGKAIDTAKAVSHFMNLRLAVIPTTASSDAPCSALSIIYKSDGSLDQLLWLRANPDLVLVDTEVIARAPAHLLAVGIGDALATWFEMKECLKRDADNFCGGRITLAAKAIARQCYETILEDGYQAYLSVQQNAVTRALENVIEANTLLSGIGFESGGICAAHPINNGLAELQETRGRMHGEKVAFALICQLVLAGESSRTLRDVLALFVKLELPVTLEGLGIQNITEEQLNLIARIAAEDPCTRNLPLRVDTEAIAGAILLADALGKQYKMNAGKGKEQLL